MMNRNESWMMKGIAVVGCLVLSAALVGCSEEVEQEQQTVRQPTPPPPEDPTPTITPVAELMDRMRIDERVKLPEDQAPETDEERKAVLQFFDAVARGDHHTLEPMLTEIDRRELQRLVESGRWQNTTDEITSIHIQTGSASGITVDIDSLGLDIMSGVGGLDTSIFDQISDKDIDEIEQMVSSGEFREQFAEMMPPEVLDEIQRYVEEGEFRQQFESMAGAMDDVGAGPGDSAMCAVALIDVGFKSQAQLWYYTIEGNEPIFQAAPTPPNVVDRLSGTDWIRSWHQLIAEEVMLAQQSDVEFNPEQIVLDDVEQRRQQASGSPSPGPGGPGPRPAPRPDPPSDGPPTRTPPGSPSPR